MARQVKSEEEKQSERLSYQLTPSERKYLEEKVRPVPVATFAREVVLKAAALAAGGSNIEVPVLGYIPAGPDQLVCPLSPPAMVKTPLEAREGCYALIVAGDSMEADHGPSIPNGAYALFCPERMPHFGSYVHVEFPQDHGDFTCTFKRYCPAGDEVRFEPLNKKYKPITKKTGEFVVRGVYINYWRDGDAK